MDVALIHSASKFTVIRVFPSVFSGKHVNNKKHVTMLEGTDLEITPHPETRAMFTEAEGEMIDQPPIKITAIPNRFKVMIPKEWSLDNKTL